MSNSLNLLAPASVVKTVVKTKVCGTCSKELLTPGFGVKEPATGRLKSICKPCSMEYAS